MTQALNDTRRFYALVRDSGTDGFHSHDARRQGVSGNPSQRAKDIVTKGFAMWTARDSRNGRPGSLYWLDGNQPDHAVPVRPNHASAERTCANCGGSLEGRRTDAVYCGDLCKDEARKARVAGESRGNARLHVTPAPEDTTQPTVIVRTGDDFTEVPARTCRRCKGTGLDGREPCAACFGSGGIELSRVNSYVEEREAA